MTVVSLNDQRPQRCGTAKCVHCGYIWKATAAAELGCFECPRCRLKRGVWYGIHTYHQDEKKFTCVCGNTFFEMRPGDVVCIDCGELYPWDHIYK